MAIIHIKELRALEESALDGKLTELRNELNAELGAIAAGGRASNPGRIRELRRTIARILTIKNERSAKPIAKDATGIKRGE